MKTILLIGGFMLLLFSCVEASETELNEILSDEEMKSRVEVEEIYFEKGVPKDDFETQNEIEPEVIGVIDRELGGCVLPKGALIEDSLRSFPVLGGCGPPPNPKAEVYDFPEIAAQYPGGVAELRKFINENIQYPSRDVCVQGRVYVTFIVEKDACITHLEVMRGGISKELNEEALRVIRSMPKWIPAQNNGKVVAARVRLPISFTLN